MTCSTLFLIASLTVLGLVAGENPCWHEGTMTQHGDKFLYQRDCSRVASCSNGAWTGATYHACPQHSTCQNKVCVCDTSEFEPIYQDGILLGCKRMAECTEGKYVTPHSGQFVFNSCSRVSICDNGSFKPSSTYSCPIGTKCDADGHKCVGAQECREGNHIIQHGETWLFKDCSVAAKCTDGFFTPSYSYSCPSGTVCQGGHHCVAARECSEGHLFYQHGDLFLFNKCTESATCHDGFFKDHKKHSCPHGCDGDHNCADAIGCTEGPHVFQHGHDFIHSDCQKISTCQNGHFVNQQSYTCPAGTVCYDDRYCITRDLLNAIIDASSK